MPTNRSWYKVYLIWNAFRFATVGVLVRRANFRSVDELNDITNDCCNCYYISQEPYIYGIDTNKRFDLSYCIPKCTDCHFCQSHKNTNTSIDSSTCKWDGYNQPDSWIWNIYIFPSLPKATECEQDNISITSMHIWEKSYIAYGNWSIGVGITYAISMMILLCCWADKSEYIAVIIFIYNSIMAELFLYWLFKPYQYYHKTIEYNGEEVECEIDSIGETAEDILSVLLAVTFSLLAIQIIYVIIMCCCCFMKCCNMAFNEGRNRTYTADSYRALGGNDGIGNKRCGCNGCKCYCDWLFFLFYGHIMIGIIVLIMMIFFAGLLIWAHIVMIQTGEKEGDYDTEKWSYIWIVNGLLFLSLFDILLFPFCWKDTAKFICKTIIDKATAISQSTSDSDQYEMDDNTNINHQNEQ